MAETADHVPSCVVEEVDPENKVVVLVVTVAGHRLALPLVDVLTVVPAARLEPLPGAPAVVIGVLNLRSELVVVVDGRRCLGLEGSTLRTTDRFVVLRGGDRRALRVDAAEDVAEIPESDIVSVASVTPAAVTAVGIARLADGLLVIHDPARFVSASESDALQRALAEFVGAAKR